MGYQDKPRLKTALEMLIVSMDLEDRLQEVTVPFLVLHGEDDSVTDPSVSEALYNGAASLKFAQYTGAHAIAGRHTPGTFTNQMQTSFNEPRLLILTDPRTDHQPIREAALGNIPTIAFCDTDSPMKHVDIGIPANNKGKHSIGCLFWMLARMVLQMRGTILPGHKWDIMVDLFFYREADEAKEHEEEEAPVAEYTAEYVAPPLALPGGDQWGAD